MYLSYLCIFSSIVEVIVNYYREQKTLVVDLLHALPLLHFLRRESSPYADVICTKSIKINNWKWWGLERLPYKELRMHITERFV